MGKKSKKKAIPKKIGGVKIPKEVRKTGGKAMKLAGEHPMIADIVAAGLLAAAAALTEDRKLREAARELGKEARKAAREGKAAAKVAAGSMGKALIDELAAARSSRTSEKRGAS